MNRRVTFYLLIMFLPKRKEHLKYNKRYNKKNINLNGHSYIFVVEHTRKSSNMFKQSKIAFTTQLDRKLANDVIRYFYLLLLDLMCLTMQINQSIIYIVRCSVFLPMGYYFYNQTEGLVFKESTKEESTLNDRYYFCNIMEDIKWMSAAWYQKSSD